MNDAESSMQDNPLDFTNQDTEESGGKNDCNFMSNLVQEVMKAINEKQTGGSSSQANFAGKISTSNAVVNRISTKCGSWLIDSGASDHMIGNKKLLTNKRTLKGKIIVGLPDGSVKIVCEIGDVVLNHDITYLKNVNYISDLNHNLI